MSLRNSDSSCLLDFRLFPPVFTHLLSSSDCFDLHVHPGTRAHVDFRGEVAPPPRHLHKGTIHPPKGKMDESQKTQKTRVADAGFFKEPHSQKVRTQKHAPIFLYYLHFTTPPLRTPKK